MKHESQSTFQLADPPRSPAQRKATFELLTKFGATLSSAGNKLLTYAAVHEEVLHVLGHAHLLGEHLLDCLGHCRCTRALASEPVSRPLTLIKSSPNSRSLKKHTAH